MTKTPRADWSGSQISAALAVGTVAVLIVGTQPIFLGALLDAHRVTLEGVGMVAMGEIVAIGSGVVVGDTLLPGSQLRAITIAAAVLAAAFDVLTLHATGDAGFLAARGAAGVAEGVLVWGTTGVIVRSHAPARIGGVFFIVQTIAQALLGMVLASAIIPRWGWQGAFVLLAALSALPCLMACLQPAGLAPLVETAVSGFRWCAATVLPLLVIFTQLAALGAFWAYLDPLGQAAGFSGQSAQALIAGVLVMQVAGGSAGSLAVRRVAVVPALVTASATLAASTLVAHALPPGSQLGFALACVFFGFAWLFMMPFHIGLAFRADPTGRLAGLVPAAQLLGSAFGPLVASFFVSGEDASAAPPLSAGFAIIAVSLLLSTRRRFNAALA
jgi:hypothetical protein